MAEQAPFTQKTLRFLRALKRNNDREWFQAHRDDYDTHVKAPMVLVIERLGREFRTFAPDLMADPKKSLYRIWRDTRFSADKRPLKTNAAAVFPHRRGDRHTSAGFYFEISEGWVWAGGGVYMPEAPALHRIRATIAGDYESFHAVATAGPLRAIGGLKGETLTRVPRGFPSDHPAADYLKHKQFLAFQEWPPELMTTAQFWPALLKTFRGIAPLVAYLNGAMGVGQLQPLAARQERSSVVTVGHSPARDALDRAVDAYRSATPGSAALYRKASARLPAGVTSNVKFFPPYPVYLTRADGAHVVDVDGREYIDYCLAFGPLICGHGHPRVMAAVKSELARAGTTIFGAPGDLELRLAERIASLLPSAEMTRFTSSGTEATLHALRLARGATGRGRVIKFEGHYHGVHDHVLWNLDQPLPPKAASDGIPGATAEQTIVVPFGDLDAVRAAFEATSDIAAVIVEPVSRGVIHPERSFLQGLRELTTRHGAVLVFDEVVTWPRVGLGGAQTLYGVTPDLTTLGKAIGGGLPLGALAGRRDLMALTAPRASRSDSEAARPYVFHGGTYNGTPIAVAAGLATLNLLEEPGALEQLDALAESLREGLREIGHRRGIAMSVAGTGSVLDFYFTPSPIRSSRDVWASDLVARRALDYRLLTAGLYNAPVHRYHLSLAHTTGDVTRTLELIDRALSE